MFQTLQLCRVAAALMVVMFHTAGNLAKDRYFGDFAAPIEAFCWPGGDAGVAFFFVLSGFIMAHVHGREFDRPDRLLPFLRRRAVRIYPAYLIVFAAVYVAALVTPSLHDSVPHDPGLILKSLTLIPQDKEVVGGTGAPVLFVAWSLQYEVLFYAVFAVAFVSRWAFWCLVAGYLLIAAVAPHGGALAFPLGFVSNPLISLFLLGMLAAWAAGSRPPTRASGPVAVLCGFAFVVLCVFATVVREAYPKAVFDLAFGVVSCGLILSLVRYEAGRRTPIASRLPRLLGDSSYALYLVHVPVLSIVCKLAVAALPMGHASAALAFGLAVAASVLVGIGFHLLIERPLLRRLSGRRRPAPVAQRPVGADTGVAHS